MDFFLWSQLNTPKVQKMCTLLERTQSSYYPAFKSMLDSVDGGTLIHTLYKLVHTTSNVFISLIIYYTCNYHYTVNLMLEGGGRTWYV